MVQLIYPAAADLREVDRQQLPVLTMDDPIFRYFPLVESDYELLIWEQRDNFVGLQQIRGINGSPPRVKPVGAKQYMSRPGVYGEFVPLDELEITRRRRYGSWNEVIDVTDMVRERQDQLMSRQITRIRKILWDLAVLGIFTVLDAKGAVLHQDSFTPRTYTAIVPWGTSATATPLADLRAAKLLARGFSMSFGTGANAYANSTTVNQMLSNTNSADLYGRRSAGLSTLNTLQLVNQLFMGEGLPTLNEFDDGYYDDNGAYQLLIPDNKVVLFGKRTGAASIGEFRLTRNANNPGAAPGFYSKVFDEGEYKVPRQIEVHRGFNGGPTLYFPSAILVMNV